MCSNVPGNSVPSSWPIGVDASIARHVSSAFPGFSDDSAMSNAAYRCCRPQSIPLPNLRDERSRLTSGSSITGHVEQCARISDRLSSRLAHSSYICDGASTKSRSTLVPACWLYSVSERTPCSTCPNSCSSVSSSLCVSPSRFRFATSTLIGFRPRAPRHPAPRPRRGVLVLVRARIEIEINPADQLPRRGVLDVAIQHVVMPHRHARLLEAQSVQALAAVEEPLQRRPRREVLPELFLIDVVALLADALAVIQHIPPLDARGRAGHLLFLLRQPPEVAHLGLPQ